MHDADLYNWQHLDSAVRGPTDWYFSRTVFWTSYYNCWSYSAILSALATIVDSEAIPSASFWWNNRYTSNHHNTRRSGWDVLGRIPMITGNKKWIVMQSADDCHSFRLSPEYHRVRKIPSMNFWWTLSCRNVTHYFTLQGTACLGMPYHMMSASQIRMLPLGHQTNKAHPIGLRQSIRSPSSKDRGCYFVVKVGTKWLQ